VGTRADVDGTAAVIRITGKLLVMAGALAP
jgi:hypothetical protein